MLSAKPDGESRMDDAKVGASVATPKNDDLKEANVSPAVNESMYADGTRD